MTGIIGVRSFLHAVRREVGNVLSNLLDATGILVDLLLYTAVGKDDVNFLRKGPTSIEEKQSENIITMHLDDGYKDNTVLHEFGHALGFEHAHLVPSFPGTWKKEKARRYYRKQNDWSSGKVNHNVFRTVDLPQTESFDRESIMMYKIPKGLPSGPIRGWDTRHEHDV